MEKFIEIDGKTFELTKTKDEKNGDFAIACFVQAKNEGKNPFEFAKELANKVDLTKTDFAKCEAVGGYVNFFLDSKKYTKEVFENFAKDKENFLCENVGGGKVVGIDFSSVNLAKHFHIGHLRNTIVGATLARIFEKCCYKVVKFNYLGDFGTPFGEILAMIEHESVDLEKADVSALQAVYAKSKALSAENPAFKEEGRKYFKAICDGEKTATQKYNKIKEITLKETQNIYDEFGIKFDSFNGEFYYSKFVPEKLEQLRKLGLTTISQGAEIVDLEKFGLGVAVVVSSEGYSLYITRDIAAAIEREKEFGLDKLIYITATEQILNFKQLFKILELMGEGVSQKAKHIAHGRYSLESGKLSSRDGAKALLKDIIKEAKERALKIVLEKGKSSENAQELASKIGKAALVFSTLNYTIGKEIVFNMDKSISFDGETGPYLQYTYARLCSVFEKAKNEGMSPIFDENLICDDEFKIAKIVDSIKQTLVDVTKDFEIVYVCKVLLDLAKVLNKFYNENRIVGQDKKLSASRLYTCFVVKEVLRFGLEILGIEPIEKM